MKIAVTVNIGNYENIKVESSEHDNANDCKTEISLALEDMRIAQVDDFLKRRFGYATNQPAGGHHPIG